MFWADHGVVPGVVRELLHDDNLERAEDDLRQAGVLLRGGQELLMPAAGEMPESVESLTVSTIIGGTNDPTKRGAEQGWLRLVEHLLAHDPEAAGRAARGWYTTLMRVNFEIETDDPVPFRALSSYLAGVIEAYIYNDVKADYWLEVGQVEAEADGDIWEPLFLATRFVRGAVRST